MSAEYAIEIENLAKVYDMGEEKVHALRGVTARFEKGSFWAIMGHSGSGKSTMLQILGCLDRPTSGRYILNGREVSNLGDDELSDVRLKYLGFVFQSFNLIPQLTVEENIALPLYYQGVDDATSRRRGAEYAAYVGLSERLRHRPIQLSGGDTAMSVEIMNLFTDLHRRGKTIVMVTHEDDIAAYAEHRLVMRDGLVKEVR